MTGRRQLPSTQEFGPLAVRIHLLGYPLIERNGSLLEGGAVQRHRLALLALLARAEKRTLGRDKLIGYLWPELDSGRARHLLREAVHVLRKSLSPEVLLSVGDDLRLGEDVLEVDVLEFEAAVGSGRLEPAADLYRGSFMDGFFLSGAEEFDHWLDIQRSRFDKAHRDVLESLAEIAARDGNPLDSARWWRRLTIDDPHNARAACGLMRALADTGELGAALQHAREHAALFEAEFGTPADPEVAALAARLRDRAAASAIESRETSAAPMPSVRASTAPRYGGMRRPWLTAAVISLLLGSSGAWLATHPEVSAEADHLDPGSERPTHPATVTTPSREAREAYLAGQRAFRAGRFDDAVVAFRRAIVEDTTFSFAYYRLSQASLWADRPMTFPFDADQRALHYRLGIPRRNRLLVEAYAAWRAGEGADAESRYGSFLTEYPEDPEGWFMLGETLFHYNPPRGRSIEEARIAFERAVALDPGHWGARWHLALLDAEAGRSAEMRDRLGALLHAAPSASKALEIRALMASPEPGSMAAPSLVSDLQEADDILLFGIISRAAVLLEDLEGARAVAELLTSPGRNEWSRIIGHQSLITLDLAEGRLRDAERHSVAISRLNSVEQQGTSIDLDVYRVLVPFLPNPSDRIRSMRTALIRKHPVLAARAAFAASDEDERTNSYLLALLDAAVGDPAAGARAHALELEGSPELAAAVRAEIARRSGRFIDALAQLELSLRPVWFGWALSSPAKSQAYERFARAEVLRALGRHEEALRWYATFEAHSLYDLIYLAPSHFRRAEIHERRGDQASAERHYRRFVELWRDADPELQPRVDLARRRLEDWNPPLALELERGTPTALP